MEEKKENKNKRKRSETDDESDWKYSRPSAKPKLDPVALTGSVLSSLFATRCAVCPVCIPGPNASYICTICNSTLIDGTFMTKLIRAYWRPMNPINFNVLGASLAFSLQFNDCMPVWVNLFMNYNAQVDPMKLPKRSLSLEIQINEVLPGDDPIYCTKVLL